MKKLNYFTKLIEITFISLISTFTAYAQTVAPQQRLSAERNGSSQRYEINQTFDGQAYYKDNNIWVYTKEFADLFGMPAKYIEDVQGIAAAAFRIEDSGYQECGFGGQDNACRKVEQCLIDLYFDESKTPLPWASDIKSQWVPWYSSMRWMRPLDPKDLPFGGNLAVEPPAGILRNESVRSAIIAFADPVSKRQAIFTSNQNVSESSGWSMSGSMALIGYFRNYYRNLSVVNLQFGCMNFSRKTVEIRLDSKKQIFDVPIAEFNRVKLPEGFIQRIKEKQKEQSERNTAFYRSLFPPPLGTKAVDQPSIQQTIPKQ